MGDLYPPKAPSRSRGKTPIKESSSILMSVIRTLSTSENNEQREFEKKRLEKDYKKSDARLETLVQGNSQSLKDAMQIFSVVSNRLSDSQERLKTIKENLSACKRLLHCKRDELKVRWLEGIEQKHILQLLEQIDEMQDVGDRISNFIAKKQYLHATELLMKSLQRLETDLQKVEAMKEVTTELNARKENLHESLIEDLHNHLYQRWSREVLALRRQGSGRESINTLSRTGSERQSSKNEKARKNLLELLTISKLRTPNENSDAVFEDITVADPEANSQHFMSIIVECLAQLGKLPEAVETIKLRMRKELTIIVQRTTKQMLETHPSLPVPEDHHNYGLYRADSRESKLLQDLLQTVFEQFQLVVAAHKSVLESIRFSSDAHSVELILYSMPDVWSKVQATLQMLLSEYLKMSQLGTSQQQTPAAFTKAASDLSVFFTKKRSNRPKSYSLFKFDASYHAITMNSYLLEQGIATTDDNFKYESNSDAKKTPKFEAKALVCEPSSHNITAVFNILQTFIREIEEALGCAPGTHCTLSVFVMDYVKDVFLAQLHIDNADRLEQATKALDQWKTCKDVHLLKNLKVSKPILQSTITVWRSIEDLRLLLSALPMFADHFVSMMCNTLLNYKETCQAAYRGITQPESEDKRIISATWAKDEDIKRFLRDLPNWEALQDGVTIETDENPEEVGERNRKEAEILNGNLGDQQIPEHEILGDPQQLRILAHLQESLEWFGGCILRFAVSLPLKSRGVVGSGGIPPVSDASAQTLTSLAKDFEELSQTCLLVLHLEVRLHCFYYLLPVARGSSFSSGIDSQEPDGEVIKLNKDLAVIDEALTSTLQPRKCKYIFEGLGPLISNILMAWAVHIRRINENGIKKMSRNIFCIQQQLTNITMTRELALDKARQYYELLYLAPQELLNHLVNRGKQFTELEYINALQLLHRSSPGSSAESLQANLHRLSEILGDVGVTV